MKNLKTILSGIASTILAHAAASFFTILFVANPASADEGDPVFTGFLSLAAALVSAVRRMR